jgi:hypothetical protein
MSVWASGPDVAELACLRGVGFRPVGRVAGCTVLNFAWWNEEEIGVPRRLRAPYSQEFNLDLWRRSEAYARLLYQGQRAAAERMAAQCAALGGDGVVGIGIDVAPYPGDKRARQFTATGTAVRAAGSLRTSSPFLAGLSAQDFTKLMIAGWMPADIAVGTACTWGSCRRKLRRAAGMTATVNWSGGPKRSPSHASRRATRCRPMWRAAEPTGLSWGHGYAHHRPQARSMAQCWRILRR